VRVESGQRTVRHVIHHQLLELAHGRSIPHALCRQQQLHSNGRRGAIAHHEEKERKALRSVQLLRAPKTLHVVFATPRPQVQRADSILHCCKRIGVEGADDAPFSLQGMLGGAPTRRGLAPDHRVQPLSLNVCCGAPGRNQRRRRRGCGAQGRHRRRRRAWLLQKWWNAPRAILAPSTKTKRRSQELQEIS
jgi:hypothetical protein